MSIADDMAAITTDAFSSASVVFGSSRITAKNLVVESQVTDDLGGLRQQREHVLEVASAVWPTIARESAITVDGVARTVREVRISGGGHLKHIVYG